MDIPINLFKKQPKNLTLEEIRLQELMGQIKGLSDDNKKNLYRAIAPLIGRKCLTCYGNGWYEASSTTSSFNKGDVIQCFGCYGIGYRVEMWDDTTRPQ